jgi:MFS transporter, PPP family, 3-phenylpropionic acid transporter
VSGSPRRLAPFAALSASYFAHIGFFNPYLPLWLKDLGYGLVAISLLTAVQSATRLIAPYGWGWLSDHTGERVTLLRYGASAALLVSCGLWVDGGFWWIAAVLFVMFLHTSAMMPMSEAALAHLVSAGGTFDAKRYGRVRLWGSLGFLLTVFAAGAWFEHFGMGHFPAWTVLSLVAVVLSVWRLPDLKESVHGHEPKPSILPVLKKRPVQWFFVALFFHVLSHMGIYIFFSLYLDALGYSKTVIGLLWAVSVLAEIVWFFTQSRWLPSLSLTAWLVLCGAVMVLRLSLTASSAAVWPLLLLAQCLHAFTFAAHHTVCTALLSHHFPGKLRGRGQALYAALGYGLTGVLGGLLGGLLSARFGLDSVFWATLATSVLATVCAWQVWRLRHRLHEAALVV